MCVDATIARVGDYVKAEVELPGLSKAAFAANQTVIQDAIASSVAAAAGSGITKEDVYFLEFSQVDCHPFASRD